MFGLGGMQFRQDIFIGATSGTNSKTPPVEKKSKFETLSIFRSMRKKKFLSSTFGSKFFGAKNFLWSEKKSFNVGLKFFSSLEIKDEAGVMNMGKDKVGPSGRERKKREKERGKKEKRRKNIRSRK